MGSMLVGGDGEHEEGFCRCSVCFLQLGQKANSLFFWVVKDGGYREVRCSSFRSEG